jgi:DNA uptake protein ComE-like DNA-binding protein
VLIGLGYTKLSQVNALSEKELIDLKDIGPAMASKIIAQRTKK